MFYWFDCAVSLFTTILFALRWYVYTDHSLPELADDPVKQREHDQSFQMEVVVSIALLVILRLVHVSSLFIVLEFISPYIFLLLDLFRHRFDILLQVSWQGALFQVGRLS